MQKMDEKISDTGKRRTTVADIERNNGGNVAPSAETKSAGWNQDSVERMDPTGRPRRTTSTMRDRQVRLNNSLLLLVTIFTKRNFPESVFFRYS